MARSIFLDPAPAAANVTTTAGLKLYFERTVNEFTAATTTTEIGFEEPGDALVAYMVAYEYAAMRGMGRAKALRVEIEVMKDKVLSNFANRQKDMDDRIIPDMESYE